MNEVLEDYLLRLADTMRKLDREWHSRVIPSYQHHDIAVALVSLWQVQAEETLRMLYGVEKKS